MIRKEDLLLYVVTDRGWLRGTTLTEQVEQALKGGATCIQLREKRISKEQFKEEAEKMRGLCRKYQVPLIINDEVELALQVDADGVHVGQSDMEVREARKRLGAEKIIGASVRTVEQAVRAESHGADYLGVGAVFPTSSKSDAKEVQLQTLQAICEAVQIPVIAIGGMNETNVDRLAGTGVCGVAVIRAVFAKEDIEKETQKLRQRVLEMVGQ